MREFLLALYLVGGSDLSPGIPISIMRLNLALVNSEGYIGKYTRE